jgi:tetrapyrrole methylase family protein/MazG family protein
MGDRPQSAGSPALGVTARLLVAGLGPAGWDRVPPPTREALLDPDRHVLVRTLDHPAADHLRKLRQVESCDDLYLGSSFADVYAQIARRVLTAAGEQPVIYAVPGSPLVGEFAVRTILADAAAAGIATEVLPAESFIDLVLTTVGYDPLDRGLRVINAHRLPDPLLVEGPTIVAHLDLPVVLADTAARLGRVVPPGTIATLVIEDGAIAVAELDQVEPLLAGPRTSMFIDPEPGGLAGVVSTMWRLRHECPWDRRQSHHSLVKNLIEETFELVEALSRLDDGPASLAAYGQVEDELGDVLLQVLFHAAIARQSGAFDIEDVAENLRQKLVRRHPHVFGEVEVSSAEEVKANWDQIKEQERRVAGREEAPSALGEIPAGLPALERAARVQRRAAQVGFDWPALRPVLDKLGEEIEELGAVLGDRVRAGEELGDLLFSAVNLARHLELDPEVTLRGAIERFVERFLMMEEMGPLVGLTLEELDARWERAKAKE